MTEIEILETNEDVTNYRLRQLRDYHEGRSNNSPGPAYFPAEGEADRIWSMTKTSPTNNIRTDKYKDLGIK